MDELGFNKLFAGVLLAGLVLMAGVKFADVLVPHTELVENAYVIKKFPRQRLWLAPPLLRRVRTNSGPTCRCRSGGW